MSIVKHIDLAKTGKMSHASMYVGHDGEYAYKSKINSIAKTVTRGKIKYKKVESGEDANVLYNKIKKRLERKRAKAN